MRKFPLLRRLAKNLPFSCSVDSRVPVEVMFSMGGLILNQKMSFVAPHRANLLIVNHGSLGCS